MSVLVYGNGESRKVWDTTKSYTGFTTWGCNAAYRDCKVDNLVAIDYAMQQEIYKSGYAYTHDCHFADWATLEGFDPEFMKANYPPEYIFETPKRNQGSGYGWYDRTNCVVQGKDLETAEKRVMRLVAERERIGAVNLLAEDEYTKLREKVNDTIKDKNEIQESIEKLHDAINKINKEGVSRLRDAFQIVNENFERLFTKLFGGGKAYLKLVQNDEDPLNSGLEIFASPPGKKMQNITLLSGGEQALTAISLLFAVFIANPSPFCILDEVDAPLDDNNVDRFCSMVEEISQKVQTKFIIITHNRMTMSRVDRLYGVTMPEEGVSQIVSVELEEAIQYAE